MNNQYITKSLNPATYRSEFLAKYNIKAYKAIKTPSVDRQWIGFFERHTDTNFVLRTSLDGPAVILF
ncbi:hypothetical protein RCL_jg10158.t1 [Rhizophagus clarus]|uniref:Uncharacterized protein n=1 Tax=Rhizophagus clarus TaxID=94130 RepID=A0A8H3QCD5_9GLOM|nr:hypothetical protein RCL_jg10158.t1 [Rhizophagus clarus]